MRKVPSFAGIKPSREAPSGRPARLRHRFRSLAVLVITAFLLLGVAGCLFRGKKKAASASVAPPAPSRVAPLPLSVPPESADLNWVALAAPILMAKTAALSPDLEPVPLWQSLPVTVEALGQSRSMDPDLAAYVASRVAAKWATSGELSGSKDQVTLLLDFIPARATLVPFRYHRAVRPDDMAGHYREAFKQFLEYLAVRPIPGKAPISAPASLREIAQALDREYGWFTTASPGKNQPIVSALMKTDPDLAKLLFNPSLYPEMTAPGARQRSSDLKPATMVPEPRTATVPPPSPQPPPPSEARRPSAAETPSPVPVAAPKAPPAAAQPPTQLAIEQPAASQTAAPAPSPASGPQGALAQAPTKAQKSKESAPRSRKPMTLTSGIPSTAGAAGPPSNAPAAKESQAGAQSTPPKESSGTRLQVLSSKNRVEAEALMQTLRVQGLKPDLETAQVPDKGTWYRVRLGPYESQKAARDAGEKLRAAGTIKEFWLVP